MENESQLKFDVLKELEFMTYLKDLGYKDCQPIGNDMYAAIMPLMFTHAIIIGKIHDVAGYEDRWCYHSYDQAKKALDAWNKIGEPDGWHRHPGTGRRRANGDEYINF